jgi:hypothetical protein
LRHIDLQVKKLLGQTIKDPLQLTELLGDLTREIKSLRVEEGVVSLFYADDEVYEIHAKNPEIDDILYIAEDRRNCQCKKSIITKMSTWFRRNA